MEGESLLKWYNGKNVLITGGTGYMGKVLIEKLLRSVPGIRKIYLLIRTKRGISPQERLERILNLPLFARLLAENSNTVKKLIPINSELCAKNLGISIEDERVLIEEVSIVFHMAATLRLEADIKDAVQLNTLGTLRTIELCKKFSKLQSFVYVSTAFCYCDLEKLDEKVHPPQRDPYEVIELCEKGTREEIKQLEKELLHPHPNSYIFSKRLNEKLVDDAFDSLPVCIVRPSIVLPTLREPFPGWVDSLNGPMGVIVAAGKGVLRSVVAGENFIAEAVPVDIAANAMIVIARQRAIKRFGSTPVYNVTTGDIINITWGEVLERGRKLIFDNPFEWTIWYPSGCLTKNLYLHKLIIIFLHYLPAYLIDFLLLIFMQKRFMVRVQDKITQGLDLLEYFTNRQWMFENAIFKSIVLDLSEEENSTFATADVKYDIDKYFRDMLLGARTYLMKEDPKTLPYCRVHIRM